MFSKININAERVAFWVKNHLKIILFFFFLSILTGFAFIAWKEWQEKKGKQIWNALYEVQKSLKQLVENTEGKQKEKTLNFLDPDKQKPLIFNEEMKKKADLYEKTIKQFQKNTSSAAFAIDLANFYYKYGETKKAKELLLPFALPKKTSSIYHLLSFQLATYYMNEKECEKALALLEELNSNKKASYFHLESDLQQAICLEHLNRYEQALHKYENILNKDPEGYTGRLAQDYKKTLILNRNSVKTEKKNEKSFNHLFACISWDCQSGLGLENLFNPKNSSSSCNNTSQVDH